MQQLGARMAALNGKTALVTGASRGIGRATALALAKAGARVLVHYGRSAQDAESLVAAIGGEGGSADSNSADLATPDGPMLLAKQVRSMAGERLDILVANAGISKGAKLQDSTVADFDNLFATNVRAPFFLVQQLVPILGEGSNIIVISSIGARAVVGNPGLDRPSIMAYTSTKGALEASVKNWAAIFGPLGVRVNAVAGSDRYRHVQFHENGGRAENRARHASPEAHRQAGRRDGRGRLSRLGRRALDYRHEHSR